MVQFKARFLADAPSTLAETPSPWNMVHFKTSFFADTPSTLADTPSMPYSYTICGWKMTPVLAKENFKTGAFIGIKKYRYVPWSLKHLSIISSSNSIFIKFPKTDEYLLLSNKIENKWRSLLAYFIMKFFVNRKMAVFYNTIFSGTHAKVLILVRLNRNRNCQRATIGMYCKNLC